MFYTTAAATIVNLLFAQGKQKPVKLSPFRFCFLPKLGVNWFEQSRLLLLLYSRICVERNHSDDAGGPFKILRVGDLEK